MFKIESIAINNFKNIIDTDIKLTDFNVVVGPNNAGKSNFLQVIPFLRWLINGDVKEVEEGLKQGYILRITDWLINFNRRDFIDIVLTFSNSISNNIFIYKIKLKRDPKSEKLYRDLTIASESLFFKQKNNAGPYKRVFEQTDFKIDFGEGFSSAKIIKEVPPYASVLRYLNLISKTEAGPEEYLEAFNGLEEVLNSKVIYLSPTQLNQGIYQSIQSDYRFRNVYSDVKGKILELKANPSLWEIFIDILEKVLGVKKVHIGETASGDPMVLIYLFKSNSSALLNQLSDGSLLILALITEVLTSKSPLILLEEPENSLHPKALTELIKFLQSQTPEKQFILTTHSPALLNLVKPEDVIVARLDEEGNSQLGKIKDLKELRRKLNKGYVSFGDLLIDNIDEPEQGEVETI